MEFPNISAIHFTRYFFKDKKSGKYMNTYIGFLNPIKHGRCHVIYYERVKPRTATDMDGTLHTDL